MSTPVVEIFKGVSAALDVVQKVQAELNTINTARSIVIEFDNNTDLPLQMTGDHLDHGGYGPTLPPHYADPHKATMWSAASHDGGLFVGCEGSSTWAAGGIQLDIHWDNPFIGGNSCTATLSGANATRYTSFAEINGKDSANMRVQLFTSGAEFVSQTPPPKEMQSGESAQVSLSMKNTSLYTWPARSEFHLGSQPQDNTLWGLNRVALDHDVKPDEEVTFEFSVTAPKPLEWLGATWSIFPFEWRMVQDGVTWFGETSPPIMVQTH
ncbi:hypothetical protein ACIGXF_24920 [Streptomyces sp. NPDC053086]|uniref:hypothetical protein n=1 Tax=unclassified Streptomyces TaxID=2593676 RepID=UPI0037CE6F39